MMGPMVAADAPLRLRPFALADLLDESFRIYRKAFPLFASISLALSIPGLLITLGSGIYRLSVDMQRYQGDPNALFQSDLFRSAIAGFGLLTLTGLLIVPFSYGAPVRAAVDVALGHRPTFRSVLTATARRYFSLWAAVLLFFIVVYPLFILFPLAFWIGVRWSLFIPAMISERIGPIKALGRSWTLVEGRWWRTFGILLIFLLMYAIITTIIGALFGFLGALVPVIDQPTALAIEQVGSQVGQAVTLPLFYVAWTLLYFDLRVRKESFDLDQLARQAESESTGPSPIG